MDSKVVLGTISGLVQTSKSEVGKNHTATINITSGRQIIISVLSECRFRWIPACIQKFFGLVKTNFTINETPLSDRSASSCSSADEFSSTPAPILSSKEVKANNAAAAVFVAKNWDIVASRGLTDNSINTYLKAEDCLVKMGKASNLPSKQKYFNQYCALLQKSGIPPLSTHVAYAMQCFRGSKKFMGNAEALVNLCVPQGGTELLSLQDSRIFLREFSQFSENQNRLNGLVLGKLGVLMGEHSEDSTISTPKFPIFHMKTSSDTSITPEIRPLFQSRHGCFQEVLNADTLENKIGHFGNYCEVCSILQISISTHNLNELLEQYHSTQELNMIVSSLSNSHQMTDEVAQVLVQTVGQLATEPDRMALTQKIRTAQSETTEFVKQRDLKIQQSKQHEDQEKFEKFKAQLERTKERREGMGEKLLAKTRAAREKRKSSQEPSFFASTDKPKEE